ncbi:MAG: AsmA family protein [Alphaproteobacteria bacterium]
MAEDVRIEKEKGSWLSFFTKLFFFFVVLMAVGIMVLSSLGGDGDVLKGSIQDYLSGRFGGPAEIETFNQMTFYPYLSVDMEGVKVFDGDSQTKTRFSADKVSVAMGFWDLTFNTGQLKAFNIVNMKAAPGTLIKQGLSVDKVAIIDEGDQAFLRSQGKIGATPYQFEAEVQTHGKGRSKEYSFGQIRPFDLALGDISMQGRLEELDVDTMFLRDFEIGLEKPVLAGNLDFYYGGEQRMTIKGDMILGAGSKVKADILLENQNTPRVSGMLAIEELLLEDALNYDQITQIVKELRAVLERKSEKEGMDFSGVLADIQISVDKLTHNNIVIGSLRFPLVINEGVLRLGPLKSGFQNAAMDGHLSIDTNQTPPAMQVTIDLKNWNYGPVQEAFYGRTDIDGRADIKMDLTSGGQTLAALGENMQGHAMMIGHAAEFPSAAFNFWNKEMVDALVENVEIGALQTNMNCAIGHVRFDKDMAYITPLLVDTDDMIVKGEGVYNLGDNYLDFTLAPHIKPFVPAKAPASVVIQGPFQNPDINTSDTNAASLGEDENIKAVALPWSLSDMGLEAGHPCAQFMDNQAEAQ